MQRLWVKIQGRHVNCNPSLYCKFLCIRMPDKLIKRPYLSGTVCGCLGISHAGPSCWLIQTSLSMPGPAKALLHSFLQLSYSHLWQIYGCNYCTVNDQCSLEHDPSTQRNNESRSSQDAHLLVVDHKISIILFHVIL